MIISFCSASKGRLSARLNLPNFARLADIDGVEIGFDDETGPHGDVALVMGYDVAIAPRLKDANPRLKIGVVDPRPGYRHDSRIVDFIVANGWEMRDAYAMACDRIFIYPIYKEIDPFSRVHRDRNSICLGYHGNRVNLQIATPALSQAIDRLGREFDVELKAMYNVKEFGGLTKPVCGPHVRFTPVQYDEDGITEFLLGVDIGLVPNLIPYQMPLLHRARIRIYRGLYNYHRSDVIQRYKSTANPGRLFYFIQAGIPVVSGNLASTGQLVRDGEDGFLATTAGAWYRALRSLAGSADLRRCIATRMWKKHAAETAVAAVNARFVKFLAGVLSGETQWADTGGNRTATCGSC